MTMLCRYNRVHNETQRKFDSMATFLFFFRGGVKTPGIAPHI